MSISSDPLIWKFVLYYIHYNYWIVLLDSIGAGPIVCNAVFLAASFYRCEEKTCCNKIYGSFSRLKTL